MAASGCDDGQDTQVEPIATRDNNSEEEIDKLATELARNYASFLDVDNSNEVRALEEALERNLVLLESSCLELESIRSNTTLCLETLYPQLQVRVRQMHKVYARIDFLERIVKRVKETVDAMEAEVEKAEKALDTPSSVVKFFTSIFKSSLPLSTVSTTTPNLTSPPAESRCHRFHPPQVFRTEDLFKQEQSEDEAREVEENTTMSD